VEEGTDEENRGAGHQPVVPHVDHWNVQVPVNNTCRNSIECKILNLPHCPSVDRKVPTPPKDVNVVCIPPVVVKVAVGKVEQLSQQVQK